MRVEGALGIRNRGVRNEGRVALGMRGKEHAEHGDEVPLKEETRGPRNALRPAATYLRHSTTPMRVAECHLGMKPAVWHPSRASPSPSSAPVPPPFPFPSLRCRECLAGVSRQIPGQTDDSFFFLNVCV